jgi:hypothetical protein
MDKACNGETMKLGALFQHVSCEWPLGRNTDEAAQMLAAAERKGIRNAVGLQGQMSPAICYVRGRRSIRPCRMVGGSAGPARAFL